MSSCFHPVCLVRRNCFINGYNCPTSHLFTTSLIRFISRQTLFDSSCCHSGISSNGSRLSSSSAGDRSGNHVQKNHQLVKECFQILELPTDCKDVTVLRSSFLRLAKMYHPDGQMPTSNAEKFAKVEYAYRTLHEEMLNSSDLPVTQDNQVDIQEKDYEIKHTAPQHRHYLNYEGIGSGTVSQRQKQYQSYRVDRAVETVYEHRTMKMAEQDENRLVFMDKKQAKKHKIRNAIDRLVEDLIQESIAKGDFENLPGNGKPLKHTAHNPYIDSVTQKLNEVLINNGFTPEWILLDKEIRQEITRLRSKLESIRCNFGPCPLNDSATADWRMKTTDALQKDVIDLNRQINKYNLLVPRLEKQRVHFLLEREANKILIKGKTNLDSIETNTRGVGDGNSTSAKTNSHQSGAFLDLLFHVFRTKW